jgi:hypothetical protein
MSASTPIFEQACERRNNGLLRHQPTELPRRDRYSPNLDTALPERIRI